MKQIEVFVDSVYQNVGGNKKEIQELKAEMKTHLLEAVHELKAEGKSEREAIDIAIERFGGEREMRAIVGQLFKAQKTFAKWVLYTSLAFLLISSIGYCIYIPIESNKSNERYNVGSEIINSLDNKKDIPKQVETNIQDIVQKNENISGVTISVAEVSTYGDGDTYTTVNEEPEYSFRERPIFNEFITYRSDGQINDNWEVMVESKTYENTVFISLFLGVGIYWVLFAIWAIINAYHQKRLNVGWALAFILFNVLGYLIFKLSERFRIVFSMERVR